MQHGDSFDEAAREFYQDAQRNPGLVDAMRQTDDWAGFVYNHYQTKRASDPAFQQQEREKMKAELLKEIQAEAEKTGAIPQSLTGAPSANQNPRSEQWSGPPSLDEILGG